MNVYFSKVLHLEFISGGGGGGWWGGGGRTDGQTKYPGTVGSWKDIGF